VTWVAEFSHDGEASTAPGDESTPALTGSAKTRPSEATFRYMSQNMYGASVARLTCCTAGRANR